MAENRAEVIAGAGVLAVAVGFLVYAAQGAGIGPAGGGSYPLRASFRSAEGVQVGTDVRLAGVKVGTVTAMALNPQTFFADLTIAVRQGIDLPEDSTIAIASEGLLGGSFVELQPGGALETIPPGGEVLDTQGAVSVISLLMKFAGGSEADAAPAAGGGGG
jgi:phospholipid/cholesterol/gamma-HCH transport system substrate-binding protein